MPRDNRDCPYYDSCVHRKASGRWPTSSCRCSWEQWFDTHPSRWEEVARVVESLPKDDIALEAAVCAVRDHDPKRTSSVEQYARYVHGRLLRHHQSHRRKHVSLDALPDVARCVRRDVDPAELRELTDAVMRLDELDVLVLRMRFEMGMKYSEIGDALGVCKSRAHRIVQVLLSELRSHL
jgi:RNA polymerase sigma factor (sigma-70 family)